MRGRSFPHILIVGGAALGAALGAMHVMRDMAAPQPALAQVSAPPPAHKVAARKPSRLRQVIAQASQTDKIAQALGGSD